MCAFVLAVVPSPTKLGDGNFKFSFQDHFPVNEPVLSAFDNFIFYAA